MNTIEAQERKLAERKLLRTIKEHPAWTIVKGWLDSGLRSRMGKIVQDISESETGRLRAEIGLLHSLLRFTDAESDEELDQIERHIRFKKTIHERREALGLNQPE